MQPRATSLRSCHSILQGLRRIGLTSFRYRLHRLTWRCYRRTHHWHRCPKRSSLHAWDWGKRSVNPLRTSGKTPTSKEVKRLQLSAACSSTYFQVSRPNRGDTSEFSHANQERC